MADAGYHRLKLWLRGERAFGLSSVEVHAHGPLDDAAGDHPSTGAEERAVAAEDRSGNSIAPLLQSPSARSLFGGIDEPAPPAPTAIMGPPAFDTPLLAPNEKGPRLTVLNESEVRGCTRCRLHETRTNTVFGEGDPNARLFFIGEGPGENEDKTGRPFIGRAGDLLTKMIGAMGLSREQVFIANVVKCRPPGNREPAPDEVATCTPYLVKQLEIIRPQVIVTLGRPSTQYMLQSKLSMSRLRGQWQEWRGIRLMPTYHPAYVLRQYTEQTRAAVWDDLKKVMVELGLPITPGRT